MAYEPPQGGTEDDLPEDNSRLSGDRYAAPPSGSSNSGNAKKADPGDYGTLPRSYLTVLTKASANTYSEEIPNAGWGKTLLGIAIVTLVTFGMKIVLAPFTLQNLDKLKQQLAEQGQYADTEPLKTFFQIARDSTNPLLAFVVPITFFGGALLLFLLARALRDKKADTTGGDFMTHAYLLSLNYTPLRSIAALIGALSLVPVADCLGFLISLGLGIFQLYSAGLAMQATQKLEPGKAQMVAFIPWVVGVVLVIFVVILTAVLIAPTLLNK